MLVYEHQQLANVIDHSGLVICNSINQRCAWSEIRAQVVVFRLFAFRWNSLTCQNISGDGREHEFDELLEVINFSKHGSTIGIQNLDF